jgi:2-polyprenyl-3-methyl-5-hydroxy-6-metoxy-1,4-benzoquinol methylase
MPGSWSERGSAAVDAGDLNLAKQCFSRAVRDECSNARHRFHLAVVLEGLGELAAAARELTQALRLDPTREEAARRLAALSRRPDFGTSEHAELNAVGLRHGLNHVRVDQKAIANVAISVLVTGRSLKSAFATGGTQGWLEAARRLCLERTSPILKDELFLEVLRTSTLSSPQLESLLTAIRRVLLLEVAPTRFGDHALVGFAVAMLQQCWINQFIWAVSEEEWQRLAHEKVPLDGLAKDDRVAGHCVLRHCLYAPLRRVLGDEAAPEALSGLEPRTLREVVVRRLVMERDERARGASMPLLGSIDGAISRRVAQFYEESPYPRWSSVIISRDHRATLARFLGAERAAFLERPFEVLIAGCGTGQQVVQAALHYGPNARILAVDLSAASLGYAARMAESFGVKNVEFAQADLETFASTEAQFAGRFKLIEAVGVLHHMAEPFAGWRALLGCLAPHGLMRIGLYSDIARRNLTALRNDRAYPGPGCDDQALRAFRQSLLVRQDEQARDARKYVDFWDARSFRDMLLHVCEHRLALAEIARFLEAERLAFRGFQLPKESQAMFWQRFAFETWPGSLENWARFEEEWPRLFENMYLFWCEKT